MITLKNKISGLGAVSSGAVNVALSEIQALFNSIGVTRSFVSDPMSDYFVFDNAAKKLYLVTIEGEQIEIATV